MQYSSIWQCWEISYHPTRWNSKPPLATWTGCYFEMCHMEKRQESSFISCNKWCSIKLKIISLNVFKNYFLPLRLHWHKPGFFSDNCAVQFKSQYIISNLCYFNDDSNMKDALQHETTSQPAVEKVQFMRLLKEKFG